MLTNLASYLLGYLGEPIERPSRVGDTAAPDRTHPSNDSDDDSWLLVDAGDENEESCGRLVRVSRSASTSSLPCQPLDESWFLTPPPCFTSTAPSGLEASPLENLLIEHPSMSVYHGQGRARSASPPHTSPLPPAPAHHPHHRQPLAPVTDHQALRCLELRAATKYHKKQSLQVNRNQLDRSNKVREVNSRSRRQRRSDRQHQHSGANNNRKCC